jgi:hypothetical protein
MELVELIKKDGALKVDEDKRLLFISYAKMFSKDLKANLTKSSLELDEEFMTLNPTGWRDFLRHVSVKTFIDSFLNEQAEKEAMKTLIAGGDKSSEALKVKELMDSKKDRDDNSRIIVFCVPQKKYVD